MLFRSLYGPIDNAQLTFPAIAMTDAVIAEAAKEMGTNPIDAHPINKLV